MSEDEGQVDGDQGESKQLEKARDILSWRPGFQPSTLSGKGGPKFFGRTGAVLEENRVEAQLGKYESVLSSGKVRKLANLGRAEWIPDAGVARITKQGKFIQHMGHHNGQFFTLHAEESLFLLDIGDIELTLNEVPMALQEAFSLVFTNREACCSLDEYTVYSNLIKRGYLIQRFSPEQRTKPDKRKHSDAGLQLPKVPRSDSDQASTSTDIQVEESKKIDSSKEPSHNSLDGTGQHGGELQHREWFSEKNPKSHVNNPGGLGRFEYAVQFPNLAESSCTYLPAPAEELTPPGVPRREFTIEEIWFQRLKRDFNNGKQTRAPWQKRYVHDVARTAASWSQYKEMLKTAKNENEKRLQELDRKMQSGKIKPLLQRSDALSLRNVSKKIQITEEACVANPPINKKLNKFAMKYNVFQCGSTPFKKTNPGKPFCRVVVTNVNDEPPDSHAILSILHKSKDVPVKFAVVDNGQVSYYAFEDAALETLLQ